ncbi:MAG: tRNA lysidine(34) synthetase TilS [Oscillospiraceae bacterium]
MKKTVTDFIRECDLISRGDRVLVAISGGADSVSLLSLLCELREDLGIELEAAHYNHRLRETSDRDEDFCRGICKKLGVYLTVGGGDVAGEAKRRSSGIEETARDMRYGFLENVRLERGLTSIATAHTADDELETVIMNLIRGGGTRGLSGIPPRRDRIIRPMLMVTRDMINEYLDSRGLPHVEDETNLSDEYVRNRIRNRVAPVLREINPRASENAAKAAVRLFYDEEFFREVAADYIEISVNGDGKGASMPAPALNALPRPIAIRVLRELTGSYLDSAHVGAILAISKGSDPSARISLPNGITARREYEKLIIEPEEPVKSFSETVVNIPGITIIPEIGLKLICRIHKMDEKVHNSVNTYYLRRDMIVGNLTLRPRREGDMIRLCGRPGKSLKKLFIEAKIPARERSSVPVLADESGVVAVIGFGPDERFAPCGKDTLEIEVFYEKRY